ncbi:Methyltransferase type 11 [Beutenbergia cavernae DSM 12333]|uniref:Methyltransferase type 11 n=1 Tax=Beutenbergia cavernae (strain ATCC BAA-8 / DSM 12333 / CCUG 43141 / JCM 11478 / NBRC 16432 / NCIMB 13614 / HKI 0122) TaxID=471853 RepID=C5BV63_BEUC1|nr:class I SAM-dependent methyltransferase [Beutenbergia cavernae]ACQ80450.1 Methyltransferase type 11 [Beutenbergia cavernae DSM 12333]
MTAPEREHLADAGYRRLDPRGSAQAGGASRAWWDANAREYESEHGAFLGDADLCWGPEGLREQDARLLGPAGALRGARVLEIGCGAAQGARWAAGAGASAVGTDVSAGMLDAARRADDRTGTSVPLVQADARALPFAAGSFDVAFTAYGAIPFVPDADAIHREVARVLRDGGRWVFSVTHPVRWAFPDDPGPGGLTVTRSYFDRRPYVELGDSGDVLYAEFHRTLGDHVRDVVGAGFRLLDLVEPEWPDGHDEVWGGWSAERGAVLPGTAIFVCELR